MAKKSKKESSKIQEISSIEEAPKAQEVSLVEEAPKPEGKFFIKPACRCITPFGAFEAGSFIAVSKEVLDHLEKHGIIFERAN